MHAHPTSEIDDSILLHRRLGDFNNATLKQMYMMNLVKSLHDIDENNGMCDVWLIWKVKHTSFH